MCEVYCISLDHISNMALDSIFESFALDIQYHITRCMDMGPSDVSCC